VIELDEPDPWLGVVLDGRYRIDERVAEGSMGAVYRGERVPLGKAVAIKMLHPGFVQDAQFLGRFEREVRVMSKLAHPNCVSVIDLGATPSPYVVMDYIDGRTLQQMLENGPLPVARAIDLVRQVLAGLAHAHEHGIVHRDIKPANIMVTQETGTGDHARILDFGLAMLRSGPSVLATSSHIVVGTPAYMSPEQTVGSKVGPASDLYSTGIVLYELVTGEKPFQADDAFELLGQHRGAPVPRLHQATPDRLYPDGLQSVIDTALAKEPGQRFASAIEFADALAQVAAAAEESSPTRAATPLPVRLSTPVMRAATPVVADESVHPAARHRLPSRRGLGWFGALLLVGGAAVATWKVSERWHAAGTKQAASPAGPAPSAVPGATGVDPSGAALTAGGPGEPVAAPAAADAAPPPADAAVPDAPPPPIDADDDDDLDGGPGSDIPADPDQAPTDQPDEQRDEESPPEPPPAPEPPALKPIKSIGDAIAADKAGHRDHAIAGLRELWRKNKKSGFLPFNIGNMYFEKGWWGNGIDHYRAAIANETSLKKSPLLIANAIRALRFKTTRYKAGSLLRACGRPALSQLDRAAKHDKNSTVRKYAAMVAKQIRKK